jgi:mono/diheme cytochrome c family protein
MRRLSTALMTGLVLTCLGLVGASLTAQEIGGNPEARKLKNPVPPTPESVAAGQALFQKNCRFCHNADAKGNGPMAPKDTHPSDLTDAKWDRGSTDGEIFAVIQNGAGPKFDMKGYKGKISDTDTWNIVNYLRSLGPKNAK